MAQKLASAVAEVAPEESEIKLIASNVANLAKARIELRPRIYIHVKGNEERDAALTLESIVNG